MDDSPIAKKNDFKYIDTIFGALVMLILSGALVQSLQYAFEEKVMSMDVPILPPLLIGMQGLWDTIIWRILCLIHCLL